MTCARALWLHTAVLMSVLLALVVAVLVTQHLAFSAVLALVLLVPATFTSVAWRNVMREQR